jgi:general L-amino acid transport system permease protein
MPLHSRRSRALLYQFLLVSVLVGVAYWLFNNTLTNLRARGIQSGFGFLFDTAGFDIGESMISYDATQAYWQAFLVGLLNTLRVSVLGIVTCTLWGGLLGLGRVSNNALARGLCYSYTELFRNIPLLLQLLSLIHI